MVAYETHWFAYGALFYSKNLRCLRWSGGRKRSQYKFNTANNKSLRRNVWKLLTVAYERHAFAYGNLDCATPCLAYSSRVLISAQISWHNVQQPLPRLGEFSPERFWQDRLSDRWVCRAGRRVMSSTFLSGTALSFALRYKGSYSETGVNTT